MALTFYIPVHCPLLCFCCYVFPPLYFLCLCIVKILWEKKKKGSHCAVLGKVSLFRRFLGSRSPPVPLRRPLVVKHVQAASSRRGRGFLQGTVTQSDSATRLTVPSVGFAMHLMAQMMRQEKAFFCVFFCSPPPPPLCYFVFKRWLFSSFVVSFVQIMNSFCLE